MNNIFIYTAKSETYQRIIWWLFILSMSILLLERRKSKKSQGNHREIKEKGIGSRLENKGRSLKLWELVKETKEKEETQKNPVQNNKNYKVCSHFIKIRTVKKEKKIEKNLKYKS